MPVRKSVTISLSPELLAVAERLLASGRYNNISEVMRTALRLLEERELGFQPTATRRSCTARPEPWATTWHSSPAAARPPA